VCEEGGARNTLRDGKVSSDLQKLTLQCNKGITDRGAIRLAAAIHAGHLPFLKKIGLTATKVREAGAAAIIFGILRGCPACTELTLPAEIEESEYSFLHGIAKSVKRKAPLIVHYAYAGGID
jgi:hypothetical protein